MATIYKAQSTPSTYIKLYKGNWLINVTTAGSSCLYSTDQGNSWFRADFNSGKIEITNSYLWVQDSANSYIWQLAPSALAILES